MTDGNPYQRTAEWFEARTGCLTASSVADIMPTVKQLKSGEIKKTYREAREKLMNIIIAERVSGNARDNYTSAAMQWGIDHEDDARTAYEVHTGNLVELTGFIPHPEVKYLGASPDGLIDDDGILEIKCPNPATHIGYLRGGVVPEEYRPQVLLQLVVTGRKWCDFVSYDPRAKGLEFFCVRWTPTQEERDALLEECKKFLEETEKVLKKLKENTK